MTAQDPSQSPSDSRSRDRSHPIQAFGAILPAAIGLDERVRRDHVEMLHQLLADTLALRDLYKKHHWQTSGATFLPLHTLFDAHAHAQSELADVIAERVQTLGGVCIAVAHDVAERTRLARPPKDREAPGDQLRRLLQAHEVVLKEARPMARASAAAGDDGTSDLLVSQVIRTNELQSWMVAEHLGGAPFPCPARLLKGDRNHFGYPRSGCPEVSTDLTRQCSPVSQPSLMRRIPHAPASRGYIASMWWFLPTCVGALLVLLLARSLRGFLSRGSVGGIMPPWMLLPMALLVVHGPPWVLWIVMTRPGAAPTSVHLVVYGVLAILVVPIAVVLTIAWFKGRRPDVQGTCISCGHQLLDSQPTCPECGKERDSLPAARISSNLRSERRNYPFVFAIVDGHQEFLMLGTALMLALLLIPTPRMVTNQRSSGTSSGTVFHMRDPDGLDYPFAFTSLVRSNARTIASFAATLPGFPSDIALEVSVQGVIGKERDGASVGDSIPVAIATVVRSRAELDTLLAQMNCGVLGLTIAKVRDPLAHQADIVRMTADGYWPLPNPNGVISQATMAQADRTLAIGEITPVAVTLGIPIPTGLLAYGVLRPRRGKAPAPSASR